MVFFYISKVEVDNLIVSLFIPPGYVIGVSMSLNSDEALNKQCLDTLKNINLFLYKETEEGSCRARSSSVDFVRIGKSCPEYARHARTA